jgi:hypothetical membrane protein
MARIAMRMYGEHFVLFQHAISDLGATVTSSGLPNRRSPYVFLIQMITSGVMCLRYARHIVHSENNPRENRVRLIRLCAVGFFLMPAPHNLPATHHIHMFGGAFIFFSLWMLTMIYLCEGRKHGMGGTFWFGMIVLQSTVLSYAFMFAINSEVRQIAQGIGLCGLLGALIWSTQALAHSGSPDPVFGSGSTD